MITNPPVLIGRTFFYGGLQIRRDASCQSRSFFVIIYQPGRQILFGWNKMKTCVLCGIDWLSKNPHFEEIPNTYQSLY